MTKIMSELIANCVELSQNLLIYKYANDDATMFCLVMYLRSLTYPELSIIKNEFSLWKGQYSRESMTLSEVINEIDCIRERINGYDEIERR